MITINEAEEVLKKEYHRDNFLYLISDVLISDYKKDLHDVSFRNSLFESVTLLGHSLETRSSVFEVILNDGVQNKRVSITQEMFCILRGLKIDNAIVSFVNNNYRNYRISLLTSKYEYDGDKIVKILSNPRRYSYSLGYGTKTKTAFKYLISKGPVHSIDELISRFSVEIVNKQFYSEISTAFTELVGGERNGLQYSPKLYLKNIKDHNKMAEFGVRLIGRIMFCWFLKEKVSKDGTSLLPIDIFSIWTIEKTDNYYNSILEPLFFEVLNTNHKYRKQEFETTYFKQIPYLNGGLFSPHSDDLYRYDNNKRQALNGNVVIPNDWFISFFNILNGYNFTVDENTSYDIELSIDPEMLGRIFENLLAEINPETGENAKKSTGSFYTPRDIVDYMVDTSLLDYLSKKTHIDESNLKELISYSTSNENIAFNDKEKQLIIDALYSITVLDPACGSGAFPIGMLQKIVYILEVLDPDAKMWFRKSVSNVDPLFRREIENKFSIGSLNYIRKLAVIQNSIFGIDIQPIAVEIARLRCFLSLIIEELVDDNEPNRGINPLPNLDFKFIIANSLISLNNNDQSSLLENQDHIEALRAVREEYFNATSERRTELRLEFASIQQNMLLENINNYKKNASQKYYQLSAWKPFLNEPTSWFDAEWMFGIDSGFDIVICNPPYLDSENMVNSGLEDEREYITNNYTFAKGNWDIYIAFFEFGFKQLSHDGCEIFITPDKWISKPFGDSMRINVIKNIKSMLFAGRDVFESALVDSIITLIDRGEHKTIDVYKAFKKNVYFDKKVSKDIFEKPYPLDLLTSDSINLITKIKENSVRLDVFSMCENACATSDCYKLKEYIKSLDNESEFDPDTMMKIINTGTIGRYISKWNTEEMRYLKDNYLFPIVDKKTFLNVFTNSYGDKSVKKKIIIKGLTKLDSCIDEYGDVIPGKSTMLITSNDLDLLFFLMGFINSKLAFYYISQKYASSSYNGGITFTKEMINSLPIKKDYDVLYHKISSATKSIVSLLKESPLESFDLISELETTINSIIYETYGLTQEEITVIEERYDS